MSDNTLDNKTLMQKLDVNGDGRFDIEDVIIAGIHLPGVGINRDEFLRREFRMDCSPEVIDEAVRTNPARAGIPSEIVNKHVDDVIEFERKCVSGIAAALALPGGIAMAATVPVDIAQYYGYMLRAAQKIMYLYGFPDIFTDDDDLNLSSATMNALTLCLGVMYGVANANKAIRAIAQALEKGIQRELMKQTLTKGTLYPVIVEITKWFGVNITKDVLAGVLEKAIPVVGSIIGGGLTYLTFKSCCDKLKDALCDTQLSNPSRGNDSEIDGLVTQIMSEQIDSADYTQNNGFSYSSDTTTDGIPSFDDLLNTNNKNYKLSSIDDYDYDINQVPE